MNHDQEVVGKDIVNQQFPPTLWINYLFERYKEASLALLVLLSASFIPSLYYLTNHGANLIYHYCFPNPNPSFQASTFTSSLFFTG